MDPVRLRESFETKLGTATLWRGLMLPENEAQELKEMSPAEQSALFARKRLLEPSTFNPLTRVDQGSQKQILASLFRPLFEYDDRPAGTDNHQRSSIGRLVSGHSAGNTAPSGLASFSRLLEVTRIVPHARPGRQGALPGRFVLAKVLAPELSVIVGDEALGTKHTLHGQKLRIPLGDSVFGVTYDERCEVYLFLSAANARLEQAYVYDQVPKPFWWD